jgi:hypothetical protein
VHAGGLTEIRAQGSESRNPSVRPNFNNLMIVFDAFRPARAAGISRRRSTSAHSQDVSWGSVWRKRVINSAVSSRNQSAYLSRNSNVQNAFTDFERQCRHVSFPSRRGLLTASFTQYELQNHTPNYLVQQTTATAMSLYCLAYGKSTKTYAVQSVIRQFEEEFEMSPAQVRTIPITLRPLRFLSIVTSHS